MTSELAKEIYETVGKPDINPNLIDDDLSELVQALRLVSYNLEGKCWCWKPLISRMLGQHDVVCRQVQLTWERLQDYV